MKCLARQYSDQMMCAECGLAWDMNDPDPPSCRTAAERARDAVKAMGLDVSTPALKPDYYADPKRGIALPASYIDAIPQYRPHYTQPLYANPSTHPVPEGYVLIAESALRELIGHARMEELKAMCIFPVSKERNR